MVDAAGNPDAAFAALPDAVGRLTKSGGIGYRDGWSHGRPDLGGPCWSLPPLQGISCLSPSRKRSSRCLVAASTAGHVTRIGQIRPSKTKQTGDSPGPDIQEPWVVGEEASHGCSAFGQRAFGRAGSIHRTSPALCPRHRASHRFLRCQSGGFLDIDSHKGWTAAVVESSDVLSDVLQAVRVGSWVAAEATLRIPWGMRTDGRSATFSCILQGRCRLKTEGAEDGASLCPGDVALVMPGREQCLRDPHDSPTRPLEEILRADLAGIARQDARGEEGPTEAQSAGATEKYESELSRLLLLISVVGRTFDQATARSSRRVVDGARRRGRGRNRQGRNRGARPCGSCSRRTYRPSSSRTQLSGRR